MLYLNLIFILFQFVVSASRIFRGTLIMLSSKPNFTTLVQSVLSNLGVCATRQFEWLTKCCSGIFITAYCSALIHAQVGCPLWMILQLYSYEWPTPLTLICLL
jgi:hypothetical protein